MEITRKNFREIFPKFCSDMAQATFVALDFEMTGINVGDDDEDDVPENVAVADAPQRLLRLPAEQFASKVAAAERFFLMQMGFAFFKEVPCTGKVRRGEASFEAPAFLPHMEALYKDVRRVLEEEGKDAALNHITRFRGVYLREFQQLPADDSIESLEAQAMAFDRIAFVDDMMGSLMVHGTLVPPFPSNPTDDADEGTDDVATSEAATRRYVVTSYRAHVFPSWTMGRREVSFDTETIGDFLAKHDMDFNKWVREGLLLAPREATAARRRRAAATSPSTIADHDAQLLKGIDAESAKRLRALFARLTEASQTGEPVDLPYFTEAAFQALCAKARSLGYRIANKQAIREREAGMFRPNIRSDAGEDAYSATVLLESVIVLSKKPIIVHNGWSDLMFAYVGLHNAPLPSYAAMKIAFHKLFPILYDTRTLATLDVLSDVLDRSNLESLHEKMRAKCAARVDIVAPPTHAAKAHDAAHDAWITGALFSYLVEALTGMGVKVANYAAVLPTYGSAMSLCFANPSAADLLLHPPHVPLVALAVAPHSAARRVAGNFRRALEKRGIAANALTMAKGVVAVYISSKSSATHFFQAVDEARAETIGANKFAEVRVEVLPPIAEICAQRSIRNQP